MRTKLGVFFSYFGGKFMRSKYYPAPAHDVIVEPFAGAAGYSLRHYERKVLLVDTSPYICGVWDYLIKATPQEILRLPLVSPGQDVRALKIPQEAQWLLGFWINQGSSVPKRTAGGRASNRQFGTWGSAPRDRIASQVQLIKHWKVRQGDYRTCENPAATWFIDPPYQKYGSQYQHRIDNYEELASWCRSRKGQVLVCETEGASWLPFKPFTTVVGATHKRTLELLWERAK